MTKTGDCFVWFFDKVESIPAETLCVLLFLIQAASLDYYLVTSYSDTHLAWIGPDIFNLALLVSCILVPHRALGKSKGREYDGISFVWVSWLLMNGVMATKTIFIFIKIAADLEEKDPSFFGPNTLKISICLASCVFVLLLTTQHDAPLGSERRLYIEELTGTIVFDILDTVDILEILFDEDTTSTFLDGLSEFILAVATMNLLIPTIPLLILSRTKFGHRKLQKHLVYAHRLLLVVVVNVPNLLVRFIVWHGFSGAISPFSVKNIIIICMTFYEFYLHKKEKYKEHEKEGTKDENKNRYSLETPNQETIDQDIKSADDKYIPESFRIESRIQTYL